MFFGLVELVRRRGRYVAASQSEVSYCYFRTSRKRTRPTTNERGTKMSAHHLCSVRATINLNYLIRLCFYAFRGTTKKSELDHKSQETNSRIRGSALASGAHTQLGPNDSEPRFAAFFVGLVCHRCQ